MSSRFSCLIHPIIHPLSYNFNLTKILPNNRYCGGCRPLSIAINSIYITMDCNWLKLSASLSKGLDIINNLEATRFEQFLKRIIAKLKIQKADIFTEEERLKLEKIFNINTENLTLAIKTLQYLIKRMLKFIFMPNDLKNDLKTIGLNNDTADSIVKVWSVETRTMLNEIGSLTSDQSDMLHFSWKLNAELSSDVRKKCKIPKAYIAITRDNTETEMEFTHPELYSTFLQFESIQNELDNLIM